VTKSSETIKWTISKEKYKIYHGLCNRFELHEIMLHCLMVMHKIDGQVGDHDNKKLQTYKTVLPWTLSIPLVRVWEQVVVEYNQDNLDEEESLGTFAQIPKKFFAAHLTEDDQHELVSVICYAVKLEKMKVQPFFCWLKELNGYVSWLPGENLSYLMPNSTWHSTTECQENGVCITQSQVGRLIPPHKPSSFTIF
jgi:hypothetical protein